MKQDTLLDIQWQLEEESRALGVSKYRQRRRPAETKLEEVEEADLPPGRALLKRALVPTAERIRNFLSCTEGGRAGRKTEAARLLRGSEPEPIAYLTLRSGLQSAVLNERLQKAAIRLANTVTAHLEAQAFAAANPVGSKGLLRSLEDGRRVSAKRLEAVRDIYDREGVKLSWAERDKLLVGTKLLELAAEATGYFDLVLVHHREGKKHRKERQLRLTQPAHEWLEKQHGRCELLEPVPQPMVVEPKPWSDPYDGGYLMPSPGNRLVSTHSPKFIDELAKAEMPLVYRAVNTVQSTAWRINTDVLAVMKEVWNAGGRLAGLPCRDDEPLPGKPSDFDLSEDSRNRWKAQASQIHEENGRERGRRYALMQKLAVAEKFSEFEKLYFPHTLDFRGRLYPVPRGGPHPQGDDIARSLLMFSRGVPLGHSGPRWLAVHLANLFGVDKLSFEGRVHWVEQNENAIVDSGMKPLDGHRFWCNAEKPWQALAACMEWAQYREQGPGFPSHLPIALDGSNSGLQHFAALLRDERSAPFVNLIESDSPSDLYSHIASLAQQEVDGSEAEQARPWQNGKVTRQIVKRPCMTLAYSATIYGMAGQIEVEVRRLDAERSRQGQPPYLGRSDIPRASFWLAQLIYRIASKEVPAASIAMEWLKNVAANVSECDLPIRWRTPTGFLVEQSYLASRGSPVEVTYRGRRLQLRIHDLGRGGADPGGQGQDARRAQAGIAPNFIHSLDASHLMLIANACADKGISDLAVIHDSFGTHAANTDQLARILRETFVDLYRADPLGGFREAVSEHLVAHAVDDIDLPEVPRAGDFDLEQVLEATYMFA